MFPDNPTGPVELVGGVWYMNFHAFSQLVTELVNGIDVFSVSLKISHALAEAYILRSGFRL